MTQPSDPRPDWRLLFDEVTRVARTEFTPLALHLDAGQAQVPMTPLRAKGSSWVRRGATWPDLTNRRWSGSTAAGYDPGQLHTLRGLFQAARGDRYGESATAAYLDDLPGGSMRLLREAADAGVALVCGDPAEPVALADSPWELALDLKRRPHDDALVASVVAGVFSDDGDDDACRRATRHPHLAGKELDLLILDGGALVAELAPTTPRALRDLARRDQSIVIPAADVSAFERDVVPDLSAVTLLRSSDRSYVPPRNLGVRIVAKVAPRPDGRVAIDWQVERRLERESADDPDPARTPLDSATLTDDVAASVAKALGFFNSLAADPVLADPALLPPSLPHALRSYTFPGWLMPEFREGVVEALPPDLVGHLAFDVDSRLAGTVVREEAAEVVTEVADSAPGSDWFNLNVSVSVDGHAVPMRDLLLALAHGQPYLQLPDHSWISLDVPELSRLRELMAEAALLGDPLAVSGTHSLTRISALHSSLVADLEAVATRSTQSAQWRARLNALSRAAADAAASPVPDAITAELRPYQVEGFRWMYALARAGLGGILADDMGLGKTLQLLTTISALRLSGDLTRPVLVIAPTSVASAWQTEADRWAPHLDVNVVAATRARRGSTLAEVAAADVVITTYNLVRMEASDYQEIEWGGLVIDEAQAIKNPATLSHRTIRDLRAPWRFAVTGTPVENSVKDVWSLLAIVTPGLLPRFQDFQSRFIQPIETMHDADALALLHRRISPFMLRRRKDEVATELPDKISTVLSVTLFKEHRAAYDRRLARERQKVLGLVENLQDNRVSILASLTTLRLLALDPALVGAPDHGESAKISLLLEHLDTVIPEGHQVLVFSQFTSYLALIREALDNHGYSYAYLDGRTRNRSKVIAEFQSGEKRIFLISLKAGGTGLTLTEADYVYIMDPWWNPAVEEQAIDRTHRIGQDKPVHVYRLASANTIETQVMALQERKRQLVEAVVDGASASGAVSRLTAADIAELLGP